MPADSPTARALLTLELLQGRPGITATELAARLGVTERAARRYVAILREADIPVESTRGPYGGYRLGRGLRLPPLVFSATEALGLVMAVLDGHHDARSTEDPVGTALRKIIRALPEPVARQAAAVREHSAAAPDQWAVRPDPTRTAALVAAVADRRRVELTYRTEAGRELRERADAQAVVVRYGRWYLVCHSHRVDAPRTYRIDRIRDVQVLAETFDLPAGFDAVTVLEENLAVGWELPVDVIIDAPVAEVRRWLSRSRGRLEPVDDEHTRLVASTSNAAGYLECLTPLPFGYTIVEGPELRAAARELADRLRAAAG